MNLVAKLVFFRDGKEAARQSGAMSAGNLVRWIQSHVATQG